jgi:hypothetical protein
MRELSPSAKRRLGQLEKEARNRFDSNIVRYEAGLSVEESDRLQHLLNVVENAYNLEERGSLESTTPLRDEIERTAFSAATDLDDHVDALVDDIVAEACVDILDDPEPYTVNTDLDEVHAAIDEAARWLDQHPDVVDRNDLSIPEPSYPDEAAEHPA